MKSSAGKIAVLLLLAMALANIGHAGAFISPAFARPPAVAAIVSGYDFSLALMEDGTLRAWGGNGRG